MKLYSPRDGTKFFSLIFALFGALVFAACTPTPASIPTSTVETINLIIRIENENRYPILNAQVRLDLSDRVSETKVTDAEGNCVFVVERKYLDVPAEIRVTIPGNPQVYVKNITVTKYSQTLQIQTKGADAASPVGITPMVKTGEITATETPSAPKTLTPVPTATMPPSSTATITPTTQPNLPIVTHSVSIFTPYPASKNVISPNTKNDLWQLTIWRAESAVYALSISPDGKLVASGEQNGRVIVRETSTGTPLYTLDYGSAVLAVAFSLDGQWLAAAGSGKNILAWNTKTWDSPIDIGRHNGKVTSLAFSPDGTLLASSGYEDKAVKLWQVGTWILSRAINIPEKVNVAVFSPDSRWIAVAANDIYPRVWDRNGTFQYALMDNAGPRQLITSLAFSPDSSILVTGARDLERCLQIWDIKLKELKRGIGGNLQIEAIAFSPDGELLVTSNDKFELTVWRTSNVSELRSLKNYHQDLIYSIVFSPNGKLMLTASRDKTIRVWGIR